MENHGRVSGKNSVQSVVFYCLNNLSDEMESDQKVCKGKKKGSDIPEKTQKSHSPFW